MWLMITQITNFSPVFKGMGLVILGLLALGFAYYMRKKWNEPDGAGFRVFVSLGAFIVLFGLYILVFRPDWWALPY